MGWMGVGWAVEDLLYGMARLLGLQIEECSCGLGSYSLLFVFICSCLWINAWRIRRDDCLVVIYMANDHYIHSRSTN